MSNFSNVGGNPNDKMPPGTPLDPEDVADTEEANLNGDDSLGVLGEDDDEDESVAEPDLENQAGSASSTAGKLGGPE